MAERKPLNSAAQAFLRPDNLGDQGTIFDPDHLKSRLERKELLPRERLTVDLDGKLSERLRIACAHLGCSKSDFAREVILQALNALDY